MIDLASYIDHTILKPTTSHIEIKKICEEAVRFGFAAVCVPPPAIVQAKAALAARKPRVATVIGFPFGYSDTKAKLVELEQAIEDGADELDIVINLITLRADDWHGLEREMQLLTESAHAAGRIVKVIIESGILTNEEIIQCCNIYAGIGVDFVKTSTGYAEKGASVEAVRLMRQHLPASVRIKASGGIRDHVFATALVEAGADRLGCSASVAIVTQNK